MVQKDLAGSLVKFLLRASDAIRNRVRGRATSPAVRTGPALLGGRRNDPRLQISRRKGRRCRKRDMPGFCCPLPAEAETTAERSSVGEVGRVGRLSGRDTPYRHGDVAMGDT